MKKWLTLIYIIVLISLISLISVALLKEYKEILYTIPQIKNYTVNNERIKFEAYSNKSDSEIKYVNNNIYNLLLEDQEIVLKNVNVNEYEYKGYYLYVIEADNFNKNETINSKSCILEIENLNGIYRLNIGSFSILNTKGYELLGVDDFYGSYSYLNGSLFLVGINIELSNNYSYINNLSVGGFTTSINKLIQFEKKYPNEMNIISSMPEYDPFKKYEDERVNLKSNTMFIPISYTLNLYMIKEGYITFLIDDKKFYLDCFSFIANELDINLYSNYKEEVMYVSD